MSAEHSELFTHALFLNLKSQLSPVPFEGIDYFYAGTDKEEPYLFFYGFHYENNTLELDIYYDEDGRFKLLLFDKNKVAPEQELFNLLVDHDFIYVNSHFELILPENEVKAKLEYVFNDFQSLISSE